MAYVTTGRKGALMETTLGEIRPRPATSSAPAGRQVGPGPGSTTTGETRWAARVRRAAAVTALVSAALHLVMIGHAGPFWSAVMVAMALACVPCAVHLWRREAILSWRLIGLMNGIMVAVHLILLADPGTIGPLLEAGQADDHTLHGVPHHSGAHAPVHTGGAATQALLLGATSVALAEALLAAWRGWLRGWARAWGSRTRG